MLRALPSPLGKSLPIGFGGLSSFSYRPTEKRRGSSMNDSRLQVATESTPPAGKRPGVVETVSKKIVHTPIATGGHTPEGGNYQDEEGH